MNENKYEKIIDTELFVLEVSRSISSPAQQCTVHKPILIQQAISRHTPNIGNEMGILFAFFSKSILWSLFDHARY